jgi:hypothetical protein
MLCSLSNINRMLWWLRFDCGVKAKYGFAFISWLIILSNDEIRYVMHCVEKLSIVVPYDSQSQYSLAIDGLVLVVCVVV